MKLSRSISQWVRPLCALGFALGLLGPAPTAEACCNGDVNGDSVITSADATAATACSGQSAFPGSTCRPSDVNCDGAIDSDDLDIINCQISAGSADLGCCVPPPCNADFDNDGLVSLTDVSAILDCRTTQPIPTSVCYQSDVDCDGTVDLEDLRIGLCQAQLGQADPSCCSSPPILSTDSPGTFCIDGDGNNSSWSWQINAEPAVVVPAPVGTEEIDLRDAYVSSINANAPEELRLLVAPGPTDACFQLATCCNADFDRDGTVELSEVQLAVSCANTAPQPGDPCFPADVNCDGLVSLADTDMVLCQSGGPPDPSCCTVNVLPLELKTGDAGGFIDCIVSTNPLGCAFNPMIYEEQFVPLSAPSAGLLALSGLVLALAAVGIKLSSPRHEDTPSDRSKPA